MKAMVTESPDIDKVFYELNLVSEFNILGKDINSIILEHLKALNAAKRTSKNKMSPRTDKFSVSQASYDCYRKIWLEMTYPRQADDSKLGTFTIGDIIDVIVKDAFIKIGAKGGTGCGKDYFDGAFRIQGDPDIEFSNIIIEVKSVSPFAWKYIAGGKDYRNDTIIIGKPKIQHVRQLNTYMDIKGIKDGVLVYVNKDNFSIRPYPVKHDSNLMLQTVGRCATVFNCIKFGNVPEKVKGEECAYCNHVDLCKKY